MHVNAGVHFSETGHVAIILATNADESEIPVATVDGSVNSVLCEDIKQEQDCTQLTQKLQVAIVSIHCT